MQCLKPIEVWPGNKPQIVPCGKCLACLSNKRRDWILRLKYEHRASSGSLFVTLTYHPRFCPEKLDKVHLQLFFKRLRKYEKGKRIRYYAVGEYGSKFGRPHYHVLLFNCDLSGDTVRKAWRAKDGSEIGQIHIGQVTEASIAYTTKYVIQRGGAFSLMSRGYGIGLSYLTDAKVSWHKNDDRNYTMIYGVRNRLPRYYRDKIWHREEDRQRVSSKTKWSAIREHRKNLRLFVELYGVGEAKKKMKEMRDAFVSRITEKVAFTQSL